MTHQLQNAKKSVVKDFGGWETDEERLRRRIKVPVKQRLEWLEEMRQMALKTSSQKMLALRWKLRANPSRDGKF